MELAPIESLKQGYLQNSLQQRKGVKRTSERLANPTPLGLLGFRLTTVLLNLHNAGLFPWDTMILAMGLTYGGLAQVIVGIMEFKKGNTFRTVAFTSYGLFWWSLVLLLLQPKTTLLTGVAAPTETAMAAYFFMWGIFTSAIFWNFAEEPRTSVCVLKLGNPVLSAYHSRVNR